MKPMFRVSSISFGEDREVSSVTAVASTGTLEVIRGFLPDTTWTVRSETENEVTLPAEDALKLFRECGSLSGLDPRHAHTYEIYDSLSMIVYGLMEDE